MKFLKDVKAPYTMAVVILTALVAIYLLAHDALGVDKAAFMFAATLIGGFGSKALVAVMVNAMNTALVMVIAMLALVLAMIGFTDAAVFKDAAVEGITSGAAGSIIVVMDALLARHKPDELHQ